MKLQALLYTTLSLAALCLLPHSSSLAACTNPDGLEGEIIYNKHWRIVQFCDNTNWIGMRAGSGATPAGSVGNIQFHGAGASLASNANLTWDNANQRLGIGTPTPSAVLNVVGTSNLGEFIGLGDSTASTYQNYIRGKDSLGNTIWYIGDASVDKRVILTARGPVDDYYPLDFEVGGSNAIRILPNGNVGIYTNTPQSKLHVTDGIIMASSISGQPSLSLGDNTPRALMSSNGAMWSTTGSGGQVNLHLHRINTTNQYVRFGYNNSLVGSISTTGTNVAYNTTSDARLKQNIRPTTQGLDTLSAIKVRDFSFKDDPENKLIQGFIAQELYEIYPSAVTPTEDASPLPWSVDYGRLTPLLVQSLQDLKAQNESLLAHINALEARIKDLEDKN